jgi:DUF438 domain-containing protein
MWNVFKETITKSAVKHIPQKRTKVKDSRPWINTEIRKNLRKLQRLYKQKKKTGDQNTKEKYNQLKHHTQKIKQFAIHHQRGNSYVVLTFVFYVCPEFVHSRVWFFLLWCYDIFNIFPV